MAVAYSARELEAKDLVGIATGSDQGTAGIERHIAWLTARRRDTEGDPYNYLLILRFGLINVIGFALLAAAHLHGLVARVFTADTTGLSLIIFAVFLAGLVLCGWKIIRTSRELNRVRDFDPLEASKASDYLAKLRGCPGEGRAILAGALRLKLSHGVTVVRHIAGSLVLLGLIGTVIGFVIALSGVDPANASDIDSVGPMISTLISGMSTALYTTLVGSILNVWLMANYQILIGGTVKLITAIQEFGERHAGD